jgi:hypothetical protein
MVLFKRGFINFRIAQRTQLAHLRSGPAVIGYAFPCWTVAQRALARLGLGVVHQCAQGCIIQNRSGGIHSVVPIIFNCSIFNSCLRPVYMDYSIFLLIFR